MERGHEIVTLIMETLAKQLGLPPPTFISLQNKKRPSGTVVRLIKAFASPHPSDLRTSMVHHTDFGTITLLANIIGGLQILAPGKQPSEESAWMWVKPQPRHLIVNLGDAMVQWTGGLLRSNVHRINYAPGEQRSVDRYSIALLVRPERDASMRRLVGEVEGENEHITAWEWEVRKTMALKRGDTVATSMGGKSVL